MARWLSSYLAYSRGESSRLSPWLFLEPLAFLARGYAAVRNFVYDHGLIESVEPALPVISVGNLTVGGTNKTPFVEMLAGRLSSAGLQPGILTRGYGGKAARPVVLRRGDGERGEVGDEPLLLSSRLPAVPVAVSRDRVRGAEALLQAGAGIAVADDAFQHRRLGRDAEIVLVDACCPFGNGSIVPAGPLREAPRGLSRAHAVVITKFDQVTPEEGRELVELMRQWVPEDRLFTARLVLGSWARWDGAWMSAGPDCLRGRKALAFSAIGSPGSFLRFLADMKLEIADQITFRDHHRFLDSDMDWIALRAAETGADCLVCTEKDVYNLPRGWSPPVPLYIPRVSSQVFEEDRFWNVLKEALRPRLVVASNGHGEDAIGALLAEKLVGHFPESDVLAFPLVGVGEPYRKRGVLVASPPAESPTGGVVKYNFRELMKDVRAGLFGHIARQTRAWRKLRGRIRTTVCVGDVYLLLHTLWGQGQTPVLLATAKSVQITGHMRLERWLMRHRCRKVWTRDQATAQELRTAGVNAAFSGNPIMDLEGDNSLSESPWMDGGEHVLLLPGSRPRAYEDVTMILEAARRISQGRPGVSFRLVLAPTLRIDRLRESCPAWIVTEGTLKASDIEVELFKGTVASATKGAHVVLGLGGTANQVCAGLGVPVVSIKEQGKFVQKKLLGGAEILVDPTPEALAGEVGRLLGNSRLRQDMAEEGRRRLGPSGALEDVIRYVGDDLGWTLRCTAYRILCEKIPFADKR